MDIPNFNRIPADKLNKQTNIKDKIIQFDVEKVATSDETSVDVQIQNKIKSLNKKEFDSFSEYVLIRKLKINGHKVEGDLKNLDVDDERTFVIGFRNYMDLIEVPAIQVNEHIPKTTYLHLIFLKNHVEYYEENEKYFGQIGYDKIIQYWNEWYKKISKNKN
ncbi:hypothetical protein JW865_02335 [Candidatus Bathyarchaeota archaeon]|nr:hypothetical protein [Candidatus Bathyarchaeota archaeon]